MYTDHLVKFALKQTAIIVAVLLSIPLIGGTAIVLLHSLSELLCSQMPSTMILAVAVTVAVLAVRLFRNPTNREVLS